MNANAIFASPNATLAAPLTALALAASISHAGVIDTVVDLDPNGPTVDGTINLGEYLATVSGGGGGFGGPVGGAILHVDSGLKGIHLGFEGLGDITGNSMIILYDVAPGGFADNSAINDYDDFGRSRVSASANPLTYPFLADFAHVVSPAFGGFQALFDLEAGGGGSLIYAGNNGTTSSPVGEAPSASTIELFIAYQDLGINPGDTVDFAVIYGNNNSPAYMSNEGFPGPLDANNLGDGPVTLNDFHRIVTAVPQPAAFAPGLLGLAALTARRRR